MKPVLKQRMSEFLKDCAERIIILKIVHRRIINRCVRRRSYRKLKITYTQRSESSIYKNVTVYSRYLEGTPKILKS